MIAEPQIGIPSLREATPLFARLGEEGAECLGFLEQGREERYGPGQRIVSEGEPAAFFILVEGEVQVKRRAEGRSLLLNTLQAGGYFGDTPLLLGEPFFATFDTVRETRVFRLPEEAFWQMLTRCHSVTREVLQAMARRLKALEDIGQEQGKLASLGTLAAGLAHELKNPAAAAYRAAAELRTAAGDAQEAACRLGNTRLSAAGRELTLALHSEILRTEGAGAALNPLEQSDREEQLTEWLEARGVEDAWDYSPALVHGGLDEGRLAPLAEELPPEAFLLTVRWLQRNRAVLELLRDVEISAARIGEVVRAIRSYSFMDQAPRQEVDLHTGLEDTLAIMAYKLRGLKVIREYDRSVPPFEAYGGELNQVWTNLIDNAADAAGEGGEIWIRTARDGEWARVEIRDDGPGIPPEVQERLFEPFFTTKAVGQGTGLGLVTSQRIIGGRHGGTIGVFSKPGETRFEVRLPLSGPRPVETPRLEPLPSAVHPSESAPRPVSTASVPASPDRVADPARLEALRHVPLLAPMIEEGGEVFRLLGEARELHLRPGEALGREGEPPFFSVVVGGEVRATKWIGGQEVCIGKHGPGAFLGEIPILLGGPFIGSVHALTESHVYRFEPETFWKIMGLCPQASRLVLRTLAERLQGVTALSSGQEKLSALGTLAAGLAHELNNPASAARRAAVQLREAVVAQQSFACHLGTAELTPPQREYIQRLQHKLAEMDPGGLVLGPLEHSDRVDRTVEWLQRAGLSEPWELAPSLAASGVELSLLEEIRAHLPGSVLPQVLAWVERTLTVAALLQEIERSTGRIAVLVKAVKSYAFADRTPREPVDLHQSLETALTLVGHKLAGVTVEREFDPAITTVEGYASELNQVWTSLLDNAADAVQGSGVIRVRTAREKGGVLVEVRDSGPGIPPEIQRRVWEPFFTTKGVGQGSGLGLVTAYRIAGERHGGDIHVISEPGDTRFQVRLPLAAAPTEGT